MMRTTLTIDDDVTARIEERRRRGGQSLKQVVNETVPDVNLGRVIDAA